VAVPARGLTVWNAQWYGGHHVLGYSLLFAPLAALRARRSSAWSRRGRRVALFARSRARAAPTRRGGAVAAWLFTAGVLSQRGDRADAVPARDRARRSRLGGARRSRRVLRRARAGAMLASPVAGVFLMLGAAAKLIADGGPACAARCGSRCRAGRRDRALDCCSPRAGRTASPPPRSGRCSASPPRRRAAGPGRRTLWAGGLLYLGVLVGAFVVPSPFGQNALRLGVLAGPSVLALAHRRRVPVLALAVVGVGLLYLQWLPAVRAVAEAHGDPSTRLAFQAEARDFLARVAKPGERVEVPLTMNHWEAADLAKVVPLARGWERQLDQKANPIFYDDSQLTPRATTLAARERRALGRAAERAAGLLRPRRGAAARARGDVPRARLRLAALADLGGPGTDPPASDGAKLLAAGRTGSWSTRAADRRALPLHAVLVHDDACVSRAPGGWTRSSPTRAACAGPGPVRTRSAARDRTAAC
jgi:hypothetical protein